jgi:hypothetical protein
LSLRIGSPQRVGIAGGLFMGLADTRLAKGTDCATSVARGGLVASRMTAAAGMSRSAYAASLEEATGTTPAEYARRSDSKISAITASLARSGACERMKMRPGTRASSN